MIFERRSGSIRRHVRPSGTDPRNRSSYLRRRQTDEDGRSIADGPLGPGEGARYLEQEQETDRIITTSPRYRAPIQPLSPMSEANIPDPRKKLPLRQEGSL